MFKSPFEAINSIRTSDLKSDKKIKTVTEKSVDKKELEKAYIEEVLSDEEKFQELYESVRYNDKEIDETTAKIFYEKKQQNKKEYALIEAKVSELKNRVEENLLKNDFVFDISKNSQLKKYISNVFGENKSSINAKDYIYLMKLKEDLDLKIQNELTETEDL